MALREFTMLILKTGLLMKYSEELSLMVERWANTGVTKYKVLSILMCFLAWMKVTLTEFKMLTSTISIGKSGILSRRKTSITTLV